MDPDERQAFFALLSENPTLLPPAPDGISPDDERWSPLIDQRRYDETHMCIKCGQLAMVAFVMHFYAQHVVAGRAVNPPVALVKHPHRWLDLCRDCAEGLAGIGPEDMIG